MRLNTMGAFPVTPGEVSPGAKTLILDMGLEIAPLNAVVSPVTHLLAHPLEMRRGGVGCFPLSFPHEEGNKRSILRLHPHFMEIAACPVAVEVYGMIPLLLPEGVEIPCGTTLPPRLGGAEMRPIMNLPPRKKKAQRYFTHLDSIAKDIEQFDPEKQDHNVEDYLRELERCLSDLPNATRQERVKLIWKTTSRSVRAFIDSQPLIVRESFSRLSRALIEEFSPFSNETSATIFALQIRQRRSEAPTEFYNRLKHAFFQGRNGPGLTEDRAFKSLFLHNLHSRTHVTLMTQIDNPPMREIRRIAQVAWETIAHTGDKRDEDPKVLATQSSSNVPLEPEDSVVSILKNTAPYASQVHSSRHDTVKGGWKGGQNKPQGGDIHHLTGGKKGTTATSPIRRKMQAALFTHD
ncbi:hypothetical protein SKAU_G00095310 [Synaphobranchus kaupii]|uniref:Retrotransposon gag domain-containing protein n=1 Tax=Synaphobranchus kaupii TaxID=118154 RepID=A0A9Q1FXB9_SYNKA|nr:hypothetical protein SKAU_G00095310 [Synaphobranchus kaupii]